MKIEKKFDQILDILYDDSELLFKQVATTDLLVFGEKKRDIQGISYGYLYLTSVPWISQKSEICQKSRVSKCVLRLLWKAKSVEPKSQPALLPRGWLGGILSR